MKHLIKISLAILFYVQLNSLHAQPSGWREMDILSMGGKIDEMRESPIRSIGFIDDTTFCSAHRNGCLVFYRISYGIMDKALIVKVIRQKSIPELDVQPNSAILSPDGKFLVSGCWQTWDDIDISGTSPKHNIYIYNIANLGIPSMSTWNEETRSPDRTITISEGELSPSQLQFSPDGTKLLANSGYTIFVIDFASGNILDKISGFETTSYSASFYGDGDMVAYGDGKLVKIYSLKDKKVTHTLIGHKDEVLCVYGFKTDRDNLFTSDFKMSLISWNVSSESMRCSKPIKMKIPPYKMKYNPGDNKIYIGGAGSGMFLMHPDYFSFEPRTDYESTSNTGYPQIFDFSVSNTAYIQSVEGGKYISLDVKD